MLQVGTAVSTRRKTPWNDLSLIAFDAGGLTVHPHAALRDSPSSPARRCAGPLARTGGQW